MATNAVHNEGRKLSVTCSHPTTPASGLPARVGQSVGVAVTDERTDGTTTVDFGDAVYDLSVKGVNDAGNSAVAVGDQLFYVDADIDDGTGFLSKKDSGYFFGFANEAVTSGATATAEVRIVNAPGPGTADILAGAIDSAEIADGAIDLVHMSANSVDSDQYVDGSIDTAHIGDDQVTGAKIASSFLDIYTVAANNETSDATYTVTGVAVGDAVISVWHLSTAASVATVALLDATDYTVTGADEITSSNAVDYSNDQLIFFVLDQT